MPNNDTNHRTLMSQNKKIPQEALRVQPVPVHIIAGGLGAGKTSAINHLLAHRPEDERWGILVNEYGEVGIDGALLADAGATPDVEIREVAGGCICCSAGIFFEMSLVLLLGRKLDRLLIEPTGLATLSGILEVLDAPGISKAVALQPVLTLVHLPRWSTRGFTPSEAEQFEAADVVVATHGDHASEEDFHRLLDFARETFPPKSTVLDVRKGALPLSLLLHEGTHVGRRHRSGDAGQRLIHTERPERLRGDATHVHGHTHASVPRTTHPANHPHDEHDHEPPRDAPPTPTQPIIRTTRASSHAVTVGWQVHKDCLFVETQILAWLREQGEETAALRVKAVVHTESGWWSYNATDGACEVRKSTWRRDSRIELIQSPDANPDIDRLESTLRASLQPPSSV